jgi:formate hydrogenlyase subunit 3/multisubunit Na+/H+ antiporter MnhD subunit
MFGYLSGSIIFLIGGIVSIFFNEKLKAKVFLAFAAVSQFLYAESLQVLSSGIQSESSFIFNQPIGTVHFRSDPLSSVFSLIISIGSLLVAVYSVGYMKMYKRKKDALNSYYFFLGLMSSSMLLLTAIQNAILFIMLWELMSIASFFLVIFENEKEEVLKAGIYYLTAMQISAAFLIAAFSWASAVSGSADFLSFKNILNNSSPAGILLFILFFIGFGTKACFVPMHTWLPKAHPAAPTGVSALMSGVMIKTGIYGILRILLLTGIPNKNLAYGVLILSIVTGVLGVMNAIAQHDLKKLLAYHSIENIGIIGIGIGVAMLGMAYNNKIIAALGLLGALLHTINHFTFKSVLFYGAGIIYYGTHTREIDKLGGLKISAQASIMFLIASLAIKVFLYSMGS